MNIEATWALYQELLQIFEPPPDVKISEWADTYRMLSPESSAAPGKWSTDTTPYMREIMDSVCDPRWENIVIMSSSQVGKLLDVATPIATPNGWSTMGQLRVGDTVYGPDGKPTKVLAVTAPVDDNDQYEITFTDYSTIKAGAEHLWEVDEYQYSKHIGRRVVSTEEMLHNYRSVDARGKNRFRFAIDCTKPVQYPKQRLPLDPYFLGVWLADGHKADSRVTFNREDFAEITNNMPYSDITVLSGSTENKVETYFKGLLSSLRGLALINNKHIPDVYKFSSVKQRLALLQGIMDGDGTIEVGGTCEYCCSTPQLAEDVYELLCSLGLKTRFKQREAKLYGVRKKDRYRMTFTPYSEFIVPFRLKRHVKRILCIDEKTKRYQETLKRRIINIEPLKEKVKMVCIAVDNPRHLYLAGTQLVPTHNTEMILNIIGYYIHYDPAPMLIIQPNVDPMAKDFSTDRLAPMIRDTPVLFEKMGRSKSRTSDSRMLHKALAIDTPLATPTGWTTMADIAVGDTVFDEQGKPCSVTYVTPVVENRPCYRVIFSNGAELVADEDHPWFVECPSTKAAGPRVVSAVVTTKALFEKDGDMARIGQRYYAVSLPKPLDLPDVGLPIDPYILGAWLGDGYSHRAHIVAGKQEGEMLALLRAAGADARIIQDGRSFVYALDPVYGMEETCKYGHPREENRMADGHCRICHREKERLRKTGAPRSSPLFNSYRDRFMSLGLLKKAGVGESKKYIPSIYLRASFQQRLSLLQGLMDTDGHIRKDDGYCVFVTTLPNIAVGFSELLHSLGIKFQVNHEKNSFTYKGVKKQGKTSWKFGFAARTDMEFFRLPRKLAVQKKRERMTKRATRVQVTAVVPTASVPVRCISVDSENHLYLAGKEMIPTHNTFPGGHLTIVGANSAAGLASRPIRIVLADEVDRYPLSAGNEGDPLGLALKRTTTFVGSRKHIIVSTPTEKGLSRIEAAYNEGTRERWCYSCPSCGKFQPLTWAQIRFEDVTHECQFCKERADELDWKSRPAMWLAEDPDATKARSFHINELSSPWKRWDEIISEFRLAKAGGRDRLRVWVNTALGETFEEQGDTLDADTLLRRREAYNCELPDGVLVLTAAVDVQDNRLEAEVAGWGLGKESWGIQYKTFFGDPAVLESKDPTAPSVWEQLDKFLETVFFYEDGNGLRISCTCIDSGGHHTTEVYQFCVKREHRRIFAIRGQGTEGVPLITKPSRSNRWHCALFSVGVNAAKETLFSRIKTEFVGPNYCHFPIEPEKGYDEGYFRGLVAEKRMIRYYKGQPKVEWVKPSGARNEPLDLRNYATAALEILNPNLDVLARIPREVVSKAQNNSNPQGRRRRTLSSGVG